MEVSRHYGGTAVLICPAPPHFPLLWVCYPTGTAGVLVSFFFKEAAYLLPALTGLHTKCSLSLPFSKPSLANVICQVNQGEWTLRWLLCSLAALPWRQAAK